MTGLVGAQSLASTRSRCRMGARKKGTRRAGDPGQSPRLGKNMASQPLPGTGPRVRGGARAGPQGPPDAAPASAVAVETVVTAGRRLDSPLLCGATLLAALQLLFFPIQRFLQGGEHRGGLREALCPLQTAPPLPYSPLGRARPAPDPRTPAFRWFRRRAS